jgi:hypothetical protein
MIRSLPVSIDASNDEVVSALRSWLRDGARLTRYGEEKMPSNWWLAQKAVLMIEPLCGQVIWPVKRSWSPGSDSANRRRSSSGNSTLRPNR